MIKKANRRHKKLTAWPRDKKYSDDYLGDSQEYLRGHTPPVQKRRLRERLQELKHEEMDDEPL